MKNTRTLALAAAIAAALGQTRTAAAQHATTSDASEPVSPADSVAIMTVLDSAAAGWNRGDLATYLGIYTADATTMGAAGPVHGVAGIAEQMRNGFWKSGRPRQALRFSGIEMHPLGADHALVLGEFILEGAGRPERTGWFTTAWTRTPHGWRIVHDRS